MKVSSAGHLAPSVPISKTYCVGNDVEDNRSVVNNTSGKYEDVKDSVVVLYAFPREKYDTERIREAARYGEEHRPHPKSKK